MTNPRDVHGILLLDKPSGITSNLVLQKVKRLFRAHKAGHGGSLDPLASGLLPICLGEATKFSRFLLEADKHYRTTLKLGIRTDSGDSEGKIVSHRPLSDFSLSYLERVLGNFRGSLCQIPPMYSAIKYQGRPLYKLARQGLQIEREPRPVFIHSLKIISWQGDELTLEIHASKGTYIRTLADDIGEALGCGAHVSVLRRFKLGNYDETQMVSLPVLENLAKEAAENAIEQHLLRSHQWLQNLPEVRLSEPTTAYYLKQGQAVRIPDAPSRGWVKLCYGKAFLGVGEILEDGRVAPKRMISQDNFMIAI